MHSSLPETIRAADKIISLPLFPDMTDDDVQYVCEAISPINCEGDVIGAVVLLGQSKTPGMGEVERKLIQSASGFLGRQMGQ